jgi:hypothetical protein
MTFVRDTSESVRSWWARRCLEWCFARSEDGKFGDQKYLDDWPDRFPDQVHILRQENAILAPWNARRFPYSKAIAWHFHGLRIRGRQIQWYGNYQVPRIAEKMVYEPYIALLEEKMSTLKISVNQRQETWFDTMRKVVTHPGNLARLFRRTKFSQIKIHP